MIEWDRQRDREYFLTNRNHRLNTHKTDKVKAKYGLFVTGIRELFWGRMGWGRYVLKKGGGEFDWYL